MKRRLHELLRNDLFILLINAVLGHTAFVAVILVVLEMPPEAILDSGLREVLAVFEEWPHSS